MQHYDVAIVGGGLVGASLAHALVNTNLKVIMLDKHLANDLYKPELDNRGLALSHISVEILKKLALWHSLKEDAYPIEMVHVSEKGRFGFSKISAKRMGIPALGYVVSASNLGRVLLMDIAQTDIKRPVNIRTFCFDSDRQRWTVVTDTEKFSATLLVGADGTNSIVRSHAGIAVEEQDFAQSAIISNIEIAKGTTTAYERFTEHGVLALLPFGPRQMKCVLTIDNNQLQLVQQYSDLEYLNFLHQLLGFRLGRFKATSARKVFPIKESRSLSLTAPGVVLLGNAANTLHPVAAQGFNLGLRDAITLADILRHNHAEDASNMYADRRVVDQANTRNFTNGLLKMPRFVRHCSILAAQLVPVVNRKVAMQGMGSWI